MTASNMPPPLPQQTLAQLQLVSHLQTLGVLFYAWPVSTGSPQWRSLASVDGWPTHAAWTMPGC